MKRFRCDLCAWGTLNMSGDAEKNASVFLVCKSHWILFIYGRLSLLWPGYETKNHSRLLNSLMPWEYLALGACSTSVDNEKLMPGPQRFLLSMSRIIKRRPARLTFRHIRSTLPPLAHAESLGSTHRDYKHRANSPERMTCRHLEYARHADASCLVSQQDQSHA